MAKIGENTIRELEDIMNGSETYADRLQAFLKLKTAPKPKSENQFVLGGFDISFDVDVDLIKLPDKKTVEAPATRKQPLREISSNAINEPQPSAADTVHRTANAATSPIACEPQSPLREPSPSPRRSSRRSSSAVVPGSDRLRRAAIHRRSRSCGRRDLLREFNDASVHSSNFLPQLSSTPAIINPIEIPMTEVQQLEKELTKTVAVEEFEQCFQASIMNLNRSGELPFTLRASSPSKRLSALSLRRSVTPDNSINRRTYTIETGLNPGQLVLTPTKEIRNTSNPPTSNAAGTSIVVLPVVYPSPTGQSQNRSPEVAAPRESAPKESAPKESAPKESAPKESAPNESAPRATAPNFASRSIQTSSTSHNVQDLTGLITDDESADEREKTTVPLNLAPSGSNITRQRRLRKRHQSTESPKQLLDLHYSRSKDSRNRSYKKKRKTVLNKPSRQPINGEEFALELARMSNYEILDLRKRYSQGELHPLDGHRRYSKAQQLIVEKSIEQELLRRNLDDIEFGNRASQVQADKTISKSKKSSSAAQQHKLNDSSKQRQCSMRLDDPTSVLSPAAPPAGFRDSSIQERESVHKLRNSDRDGFSTLSTSPAIPPIGFRNSSYLKHQSISELPPRRSGRKRCSSPEPSSPAASPGNPRDSSLQKQISTRHMPPVYSPPLMKSPVPPSVGVSPVRVQRSSCRPKPRSRNLTTINNTNELIVSCTPPPQFRLSKSRHPAEVPEPEIILQSPVPPSVGVSPVQEQRSRGHPKARSRDLTTINNTNELILTYTPPPQFRLSKSRLSAEVPEPEIIPLTQPPMDFADIPETDEENEIHAQISNRMEEIHQETPSPPDALETDAADEMQAPISMHMEQLHQQMLSPPKEPEPVSKQSRKEKKISKKSLSLSTQNSNKENSLPNQEHENVEKINTESIPPEDIFKKPTAPAPRSRKAKFQYELNNLKIGLPNETLPPDHDEGLNDTSGVRKSKRGHMPLRNVWSHTLTDPFAFMRNEPKKNKLKPVPRNSKKPVEETLNSIVSRAPLFSSTPRNTVLTDNKHQKEGEIIQQEQWNSPIHEDIISSNETGITPVSTVTEQPVIQPLVDKPPTHIPEEQTKPKRRDRKKKVQSGATKKANKQIQEEPQPPPCTSPVNVPQEEDLAPVQPSPEIETATQSVNQTQEQPFPFISFLLGDGTIPADTTDTMDTVTETDTMLVSRASNLQFSNLDGIDYAFYKTGVAYSVGYMRFKPNQARGYKRAKTGSLLFLVIYGEFDIESSALDSTNNSKFVMYAGDSTEVKKGSRYNIVNRLDKVSLMMVYRK